MFERFALPKTFISENQENTPYLEKNNLFSLFFLPLHFKNLSSNHFKNVQKK